MTNQYGRAAVIATDKQRNGECNSPREAWSKAIKTLTKSIYAQNKSCPRSAYLGLCEAGLVKGVPAGEYITKLPKLNKGYAVKAVSELRKNSRLQDSPIKLWELVIPEPKAHDSQMDVVIALWKKQKIKR
ncbi:MAG: hypothetical protein OXU29_05195 [Gammaproteobacteria bacterium]|nr:hypothetical protein [Gammaproteobacteria bacterium]